jgi:deaminated glutathione amidase
MVESTRAKMPVVEHRRPDLYATDLQKMLDVPYDDEIFTFGQVKVRGASVIAKSSLSYAFTNKKCVVPGRILFQRFYYSSHLSFL